MEREAQLNQELRKSYESKLLHDQSIKYQNQPSFIQAGLWFYQKYSNVRAQSFYQIFFAAELLKTLGNNYYKQQKIEQALEAYQEAVSIFRYIKPNKDAVKRNVLTDKDLEYVCYSSDNENENRKVKQIQHVLYLNLSIGYIKTQQYANAIAACTFDLEIEPLSVKSLYRRALARFSQNSRQKRDLDLKQAIADLKKALEVDPADEDIKELLCQIEENQNFKKQNIEQDNRLQSSDLDHTQNSKGFSQSNNFNDNQSVSSSTSSRTVQSIQKSQQSSSVLKEMTPSASFQPQKQVETDLISAKSTPQTLEKVNSISLPANTNDQSKEVENKENNSINNNPQSYANHLEYLMKTQPKYEDYYNRLQELAQKRNQQTKEPGILGNRETSKASAASILQNFKNGNQQQQPKQQPQQQKQQQEKQQQQQVQQQIIQRQKFEDSEDEEEEEKDDSAFQKQQQLQQQKQLSSQDQKLRAKENKEKKKLAEQLKALKLEEEKESKRRKEQEAEMLKIQKLEQQKKEQKRIKQELIEQEIARNALKSRVIDGKTSIKKGQRKIKMNATPSTTIKPNGQHAQNKEQLSQQAQQQQSQQQQYQQQQQIQQMIQRQNNDRQQQNNSALNLVSSAANSKKPNLKPKQNFEEDDLFDKKEEMRLQQYHQQRGDDEDEQQQFRFNDPLEQEPPYLPPKPTNDEGQLDLCEGNQILIERQKDKVFQNSYKANYQDYLDQKHMLDSDTEIPEIPGLIPPSYKTYAQKRREALLNENTSQEKKELKKYQKILLWVSLLVFIFTLWWAMGDEVPELPAPIPEQLENDDFIADNLIFND